MSGMLDRAEGGEGTRASRARRSGTPPQADLLLPGVPAPEADRASVSAGERISGKIVDIRFHYAGGNAGLMVECGDERRFVVAPWIGPAPVEGMQIAAFSARKVEDGRYGVQWAANAVGPERPITPEGFVRWVKTGAVQGVGDATAKRLVRVFGGELLAVMSDATRLAEGGGIPLEKAEAIVSAWNAGLADVVDQDAKRLMSLGFGPSVASKIAVECKGRLDEFLNRDPWALAASVGGIGFGTADKIALEIGIPRDHPSRIRAALMATLQELCGEKGHTAPPALSVVQKAAHLLAGGQYKWDKLDHTEQREVFGRARLTLKTLIREAAVEHVVLENGVVLVQLPWVAAKERELGRKLAEAVSDEHCRDLRERLKESPRLRDIARRGGARSLGEALKAVVQEIGPQLRQPDGTPIQLTDEQKTGVVMSLCHRLSILTGGPGRGKTTTVQAVVAALRAVYGESAKIEGCSPTANAAERMGEFMSSVLGANSREPRTVHSLLRLDLNTGKAVFNEKNKLELDFLIVDEASMKDQDLALALLRAIDFSKTSVLFVGDVDQLPSVGPGQVLRDMIGSNRIPVATLSIPQRVKKGSGIHRASSVLASGKAPRAPGDAAPTWAQEIDRHAQEGYEGYAFLQERDAGELRDKIVRMVAEEFPRRGFHPINDTQVMAPGYKGKCGVNALNVALQERLNPPTAVTPYVATNRTIKLPGEGEKGDDLLVRLTFNLGDKVLHTSKNDRDRGLINGRVGTVVGVLKGPSKKAKAEEWCENATTIATGPGQGLLVDFGKGRLVRYAPSDLQWLELGYAISVHKMQGGERPATVTVTHNAHYTLLFREIVYTGMTRGKRLSVVCGDPDAFRTACHRKQDRHTLLGRRIETPEDEPVKRATADRHISPDAAQHAPAPH